MSIPESQLETWSHSGSVQQSASTYQTIRNALCDAAAPYAAKSFDVFLQGSYGNDTNIYGDSDVDVVIRLGAIFGYDLQSLPTAQQAAFQAAFPAAATYTFAEFKQGVLERLSLAFGRANVTSGNKAIKIAAAGSRRSADVVPCYLYRRYTRFLSANTNDCVPGIIFPNAAGEHIVNYPKAHSENCTSKHQATNNAFKPLVRIVKNMRGCVVERRVIAKDVAPSYFIEGAFYNVPNDKFRGNYGTIFCNCLNWLLQTDKSRLLCANEQTPLLGNSSVQWPSVTADQFFASLVTLWQQW